MTRWTGLREPHRRILGHVVGDWRPLAGSLRTASVGSSRVYIPQVFFCRPVRGFDPKSGTSFFLDLGQARVYISKRLRATSAYMAFSTLVLEAENCLSLYGWANRHKTFWFNSCWGPRTLFFCPPFLLWHSLLRPVWFFVGGSSALARHA